MRFVYFLLFIGFVVAFFLSLATLPPLVLIFILLFWNK
jgi:hypothetical protein